MEAPASGASDATHLALTFENNRLASELFGQFDQNLALIEQKLKVDARSRGNTVSLRGDWGADVRLDLTVWPEGDGDDQRLVAEGTITVRDVAIEGRWELPLYWRG